MERAWMKLFKTEIDQQIGDAVNNATRVNLFTYVQDGDMMLDRAAKRAGMSTADFADSMTKAGFRIPKM